MKHKLFNSKGERFKTEFKTHRTVEVQDFNGIAMRYKRKNPTRHRLILIVMAAIACSAIGSQAVNGQTTLQQNVAVDTQLAQPSIDAATSGTTIESMPSHWMGVSLEEVLVVGSIALLGGFLVYNLVTARKNGWGWFVLLVAVGVAAFFVRLGVSIFQELAGGHCPSDWDES